MSALPSYRAVSRTQGNNAALKDGTVKPRTFTFAFEEVDPLVAAFRRMVRNLEYDISEMAITTYITARRFGKRFTALPVFIVRGFHHGAVLVNTKAGIRSPKDLEGKRVGVNRGYTVTTGVWARGILHEEYGVDLDRITWVRSGDEHVAEFVPPSNVVQMEEGRTLAEMLASGEIAAAIGVEVEHPDVAPLFPDAFEAGLRAVRERGIFPINHTVVVKDELLAEHPELAADVFDAFAQSKRLYLARLRNGAIEKPTKTDEMHRSVMAVAGDPLPYGVDANRPTLERLIDHAVAQRIIPERVPIETLFAPSTLEMSA